MRYTIEAIAVVRSPYKQKFGIARQPGLAPATEVYIKLDPKFAASSVCGLESFECVWISPVLHSIIGGGWSSLIYPPRLDGRRKMGVFAIRSPHRPNHMGLSLLKLERIETGRPVKIYCNGTDLLDNTPVMDTKPYIPSIESKPNVHSGFTTERPEQLNTEWAKDCGKELSDKGHEITNQDIA